MEIRVLRYFLTVVREESITKAAQALHITQPTLSRQLAQMEQSMGVKLFVRGTRKIVLTNEGMLLRRRAEEILELVDKTERELAEQDEQVEGIVAIGCGDLKSVQKLPGLIRTFHEKYPLVTFDLYTATADHIKERMDRGLTDIGLLLEPVDLEKYDFIRLAGEEQCVVTMHPDAPLASKEYIRPEDLTGVPLIMPKRATIQGEIASWFGDYYDRIHVLFTSNLPASSGVMANQRLAYSINTCGSVDFWDRTKLTSRPLMPPLTSTCALAWKRHQPFGTAAEKFISHVKKCLTAVSGFSGLSDP